MASDPFEDIDRETRPPSKEDHLSMCADFTLIERLRKDLRVVYRCISCDFRFTEDDPDIEALTYDAFRYMVPIVHPQYRREA